MDRPRPWLRYVEASDLSDTDIDFDGLPVTNATGAKLGDVDGFVIDADSARPYYVVVDAGGWFRSKHYLLPVGHAQFDAARQRFVADLSRDRIDHYPGFDLDEFDKLTDAELERLDERTAAACCPEETGATNSASSWGDRWSHYQTPDWWNSNYYRPDRAGSAGVTTGAEWSSNRSANQAAPSNDQRRNRPAH